MAVDAFIWFQCENVDFRPLGESADDTYKGFKPFEIKDFSLSIENPSTIGSATTGAGGGKVKFNEFTIKKPTDSASALFFRNCCSGMHYTKVTIVVRKATGDADASGKGYLYFTFNTVFTTKVEWSGPGDEGPEESITFVYGKLGIRYIPQNEKGVLDSAKKSDVGWDQMKNKKWDDVTAS